MVSATLLNSGRVLDAVELLMACNCTEDAIRQLLEQRQFSLAAQINSIVQNSESSKLKDLIDQKWTKHLIKVSQETVIKKDICDMA